MQAADCPTDHRRMPLEAFCRIREGYHAPKTVVMVEVIESRAVFFDQP